MGAPSNFTVTPRQQAAATRTVAARARDTADCRRLLDMLGLTSIDLTETPKPKRRGRPSVDHGHGHPATYQKGCRCTECREAHRKRCAAAREARAGDPAAADRAGHGKASTYKNYGCRCTACSQANTAKVNAYRARRRALGAAA